MGNNFTTGFTQAEPAHSDAPTKAREKTKKQLKLLSPASKKVDFDIFFKFCHTGLMSALISFALEKNIIQMSNVRKSMNKNVSGGRGAL